MRLYKVQTPNGNVYVYANSAGEAKLFVKDSVSASRVEGAPGS